MNRMKLAMLGALTLAVGGCSNMMGGSDPAMPEPAAGPATNPAVETPDEQGMAPGAPGGMMDSDDQEGRSE